MKDTTKQPPSSRGVQLLSPSTLRATTGGNQHDHHARKPAVFDFDSFTLEAVRRRHDHERSGGGGFLHASAASSSGGSPRSPSLQIRGSSRGFPSSGSYDRLTSLDGGETSSVRSMEDYDWANRNTQVSNSSSRYHHHLSSMSSVGTGMGKRMSMASSSASSAMRGARAKLRAEVVVRGWLQRRRGRMIKRWKAQYCVLKTDQKLCVYASEDTVNGRLDGRFQLLRATYNDKHNSFQVIGIGSDETPYKEEFRPLDDDGWRAWFQALREFFDAASLHEALERMPELSLVPGVSAALLENDDDDDDSGDFAHELEEMIMRPYAFGGGGGASSDERVSMSNTSSRSTTSSNQRSYAPVAPVAPAPAPLPSEPSQRKTILFDVNEFPRYTVGNQQTDDVPRPQEELPEYMHASLARASNYRKLYTGGTRSKASSIASSVASSGGDLPTAASDARLRRGPSDHFGPGGVDCPMIERDSQNAMAILEGRGSESVVSSATHDSDDGFSWHRP